MHFIAYRIFVYLCSTRNTLPNVPSPIRFFISKSASYDSTFLFFLNIDWLSCFIDARSLLISKFVSSRLSKFSLTSAGDKSSSPLEGYSCFVPGKLDFFSNCGFDPSYKLEGYCYYSRISSRRVLPGSLLPNVMDSILVSAWAYFFRFSAYCNWRCYSAIDTNPGVGPFAFVLGFSMESFAKSKL